MTHYLASWWHWTACFYGLMTLLGSSAIEAVPPSEKFIVLLEMEPLQKQVEALPKKIQRVESQLANMKQTSFSDESSRQNYEARKTSLREEITKLQGELFTLNQNLAVYQEKKTFFPNSHKGKWFDYYYSAPLDIQRHEHVVERISNVFAQLFTTSSFDFQIKPQILIYPSLSNLVTFEGAAGDIRMVQTEKRNPMGVLAQRIIQNRKLSVIATFSDESLHAFSHQIALLYLDRYLNPLHTTNPKEPNLFLMEGFLENIALTDNEVLYEKKVSVLDPKVVVADLSPFLEMSSLNTTHWRIESILFVRWLNTLPNAPSLIRQLLNTKTDQLESVLRIHQENAGKERSGFTEYFVWRSKELQRLQEKREPKVIVP
jgi:hypothetical protein